MTVITGKNDIRCAQLLAAKHAICLEAKGLRHSRLGQNGCRRAWAKHYGLSPRAKAEVVLARIQQEIDELSQIDLPLEQGDY